MDFDKMNQRIANAERAKDKAKKAIKKARLAKPELFGRWLLDNCRPVKKDNDGNTVTITVNVKDASGNTQQKNVTAHRYLNDLNDFNNHYLIIDKGGTDGDIYRMGEYVKKNLNVDNVNDLKSHLNSNQNKKDNIPFQN